jgi:hypothetical protein
MIVTVLVCVVDWGVTAAVQVFVVVVAVITTVS